MQIDMRDAPNDLQFNEFIHELQNLQYVEKIAVRRESINNVIYTQFIDIEPTAFLKFDKLLNILCEWEKDNCKRANDQNLRVKFHVNKGSVLHVTLYKKV